MRRASQISQRPADPISVPIELRGEQAFVLEIDKSKVSRRWANSADDDFYGSLGEVVLAWDLVNDDDSPYELSKENWLDLGLGFEDEFELVEQIVKACVPSRAEGNVSSSHSSTTSEPADNSSKLLPESQNGLETSTSPASSAAPSLT